MKLTRPRLTRAQTDEQSPSAAGLSVLSMQNAIASHSMIHSIRVGFWKRTPAFFLLYYSCDGENCDQASTQCFQMPPLEHQITPCTERERAPRSTSGRRISHPTSFWSQAERHECFPQMLAVGGVYTDVIYGLKNWQRNGKRRHGSVFKQYGKLRLKPWLRQCENALTEKKDCCAVRVASYQQSHKPKHVENHKPKPSLGRGGLAWKAERNFPERVSTKCLVSCWNVPFVALCRWDNRNNSSSCIFLYIYVS